MFFQMKNNRCIRPRRGHPKQIIPNGFVNSANKPRQKKATVPISRVDIWYYKVVDWPCATKNKCHCHCCQLYIQRKCIVYHV